MKAVLWTAGGIVALGLLCAPGHVSAAMPVVAPALADTAEVSMQPENVAWIQRCQQERRWWNGGWHWVPRCKNIWVGPGPRYVVPPPPTTYGPPPAVVMPPRPPPMIPPPPPAFGPLRPYWR